MNSPTISIIILNFNAGDLLLENIRLLKKTFTSDIPIEVIVADNASSDGSFERVQKEFPWVIPVDNKKNLGFAAGNNRAVPHATGKYILFLNPDMRVEDAGIWKKLVTKMESEERVGALGVKVVFANGTFDKDSKRGFPTPWNSLTHFSGLSKVFKGHYLFDSYYLGYLDSESEHEVDEVPGSFLFVRREAGESIGWWDEDYFFYGEDLQFCFDLQKKGWKVVYYPVTSVIHYKGYSSGIRKESAHITKATLETKRRIAKASVDAMRIFYSKNYKKRYPYLIDLMVSSGLNILEKRRLAKYSDPETPRLPIVQGARSVLSAIPVIGNLRSRR